MPVEQVDFPSAFIWIGGCPRDEGEFCIIAMRGFCAADENGCEHKGKTPREKECLWDRLHAEKVEKLRSDQHTGEA